METVNFAPILNLQVLNPERKIFSNTNINIGNPLPFMNRKEKKVIKKILGLALTHNLINNSIIYNNFDESSIFNDNLTKFLSVLWLIKDNAVDISFLVSIDYRRETGNFVFNSTRKSKSDGSYDIVSFDDNEFKLAAKLVDKLIQKNVFITVDYLDVYSNNSNQFIYSHDKTLDYNNLNRLQIAWRFIQLARTQTFINSKISFFIMALESIFSNSKENVLKQVCFRTANFISESEIEKQSNTKILKKAYDIRSGYLHGSQIDVKDIEGISRNIDIIVRKTIIAILNSEDNFSCFSDDDYENWLIKFNLDFKKADKICPHCNKKI